MGLKYTCFYCASLLSQHHYYLNSFIDIKLNCIYLLGPFNPHNPNHYSGGSSGGSAVSVALGLTPVAIGYDGGGSIRTPASLSGVVGIATGFGRLPFESHRTGTNIKSGGNIIYHILCVLHVNKLTTRVDVLLHLPGQYPKLSHLHCTKLLIKANLSLTST